MQMFWVVAGLALGGGTVPLTDEPPVRKLRWLTVPAMLTAALAFLLLVVRPAVRSASASYSAHLAATHYSDKFYPDAINVPPKRKWEQEEKIRAAVTYLNLRIFTPLNNAPLGAPTDAGRHPE